MNTDYFIIDDKNNPITFSDYRNKKTISEIVIYGDKRDAIDDMFVNDKLGTLLYSTNKDNIQHAEVYIDSALIGDFVYDDKVDNFQDNFKQFLTEHNYNV